MTTHKIKYLIKKGLDPQKSYSIKELSNISGYDENILQKVFNRGIGAWKTNPQSVRSKINPKIKGVPKAKRMSAERWGYARVYSFLNDGKTAKTADKDLKGGGIESKEKIKEIKSYPLSNHDIQDIMPHTKIFTYPELEHKRSIDEVFKFNNNGIGTSVMLFLTDNNNTGHWIGLIKRGNKIEMYDPYGFKPEKLYKLGGQMSKKQDLTLLRDLVERSGYELDTNSKQVQPMSHDIQTCGRHVITRLLFANLDNDSYNKKMGLIAKKNGVSIDDIVSGLTFEMLDK